MPNPGVTLAQAQEAIDLVWKHIEQGAAPPGQMSRGGQVGAVKRAATELGFQNESSFFKRLHAAKTKWGLVCPWENDKPSPKPFAINPLPDVDLSVDEIRLYRKRQFEQKAKAHESRKLITARVQIDGPFGIAHFGDPHVDDDGTDLDLLERHMNAVNRTEGLFGGSVGDVSNNWVGRLARLYGEQGTTAKQAWMLAEWFVSNVSWLYIIGGNHDCWSGAGDPLQWMTRSSHALYESHGARLGLETPSGRTFRVNARHTFPGHSQWNTAHGIAKAAQLGKRDHVLACGHTHVSGYQVLKDPGSGLISHALQVASYKTHDRYADEKGLDDKAIFMCPVTIFDPQYPDDDVRAVHTVFDPEEGADYLTWKRAKWAEGKRHSQPKKRAA